jgi:hypothetical protein
VKGVEGSIEMYTLIVESLAGGGIGVSRWRAGTPEEY